MAEKFLLLKRVPYTKCADCIFYDVEKKCTVAIEDSSEGIFACYVGNENMMWVQVQLNNSKAADAL